MRFFYDGKFDFRDHNLYERNLREIQRLYQCLYKSKIFILKATSNSNKVLKLAFQLSLKKIISQKSLLFSHRFLRFLQEQPVFFSGCKSELSALFPWKVVVGCILSYPNENEFVIIDFKASGIPENLDIKESKNGKPKYVINSAAFYSIKN